MFFHAKFKKVVVTVILNIFFLAYQSSDEKVQTLSKGDMLSVIKYTEVFNYTIYERSFKS